MAFEAQVSREELDTRFAYDPMLSSHPKQGLESISFLGRHLALPIWVSSMTGGTELAAKINRNLARACAEFGMGMGLGSCRSLLEGNDRLSDFNVRHIIGEDLPLYGNLGIAQVEQLLKDRKFHAFDDLIDRLQLDGLIIHVNPLQEALQPEGDSINEVPLETIKRLIDCTSCRLIVKEVGQGFGYNSLKEMFQLPLAAIDFGASGGTNFALLEMMRSDDYGLAKHLGPLSRVGHSAEQMVQYTNRICDELGDLRLCPSVIVSGGVANFLDGFYYISKLSIPGIYGQASAFLKHAMQDYQSLHDYVQAQSMGLDLAKAYLSIKA
ncbi:MAG: isopentenyl-diphosphate delta-isomerase [Saprospiraceae bacterium]|nr:isopentenyl-diphosphate delta-isomerase [Saprospiraceae bacterium]